MRQLVVKDGVLGEEPFPEQNVSAAESVEEVAGVSARPLLEEVEMLFASAAGQVVAATLQEQRAVSIERQPCVRPVELLLDNEEPARDFGEGDTVKVLVARLQARTFQMTGARI